MAIFISLQTFGLTISLALSSSNTISCSQIFEEAYAINYLLIYEHAKQCSGSGIYWFNQRKHTRKQALNGEDVRDLT